MNVGDRVIFTDNCTTTRASKTCNACDHTGEVGVVTISDRGEHVVGFLDGFTTWATTDELEVIA